MAIALLAPLALGILVHMFCLALLLRGLLALGPLALDKAKELLLASYPGADCGAVLEEGMLANVTVPVVDSGGLEVEEGLVEVCRMVGYGQQVLTIAVLVILITAPIGAVAIMTSGPRLLTRQGGGEAGLEGKEMEEGEMKEVDLS